MQADSLATLATSSAQGLPQVILVEDLYKPTKVKGEKIQVHYVRVGSSWMNPIVLFLKNGILPEERRRLTKCVEKHLFFGCSRIKNYTNAPFLGYICCASILKQ